MKRIAAWVLYNVIIPFAVLIVVLALMVGVVYVASVVDTPAEKQWRSECMRVLELTDAQCKWLDDYS